MSKQFEDSFSWNVKRYEFNKKTIEDFDVIPFISVIIRKLKRQSVNKEEFAKKLSSEMKFRFCWKSEFEIEIEHLSDGRILLKPWFGYDVAGDAVLDVTDNIDFDWKRFAEKYKSLNNNKNEFTIDVWNQLSYRWNDFVTYCWEYGEEYDK
jgi:hypothetical protein